MPNSTSREGGELACLTDNHAADEQLGEIAREGHHHRTDGEDGGRCQEDGLAPKPLVGGAGNERANGSQTSCR